MNKEDYFKYYIQGSDHYLIPKDVFDELFDEMENWKEEAKELKMNDFIDKRNKMLMNLESINYDEIVDFCNEFNILLPNDMTSMLAGLHKARLYVVSIPDDLKEKSKLWLKENGFSEEIIGGKDER